MHFWCTPQLIIDLCTLSCVVVLGLIPNFLEGLRLVDVSHLATTSLTHMYHEPSAVLKSKNGSTSSAQVEIRPCQHSMM